MNAIRQVIDTSAWIEALSQTDIGRQLAPLFPRHEECIVPTIVQLELSKWLRRVGTLQAHDRILASTCECVVQKLDTETAVLAARYHADHRLATADAVVYATARRHGVGLLTCDAHFRGLPAVTLVEKGSSRAPRPASPHSYSII